MKNSFYRNDDDSDEEEIVSKTQSNTGSKGESSANIDEYNFKTYDDECRKQIFKLFST